MAAYSFFYGLTADKKLVGGDTALITSKQQRDEMFDWFKTMNCIVGFFTTHWECGFVERNNTTWFGDRAYEAELNQKLLERYPEDD